VSVVNVLSGGAAAAVVKGVQAQFERETGAAVQATFSAVGEMRDPLLAGTPCDLVILTKPLVAQLVASGHVVAGSERSLGLVCTGGRCAPPPRPSPTAPSWPRPSAPRGRPTTRIRRRPRPASTS